MIYKTPSPHPNYVHVVFELPESLWADRVYLVGDFNNWQVGATPLRQNRRGAWRAALELVANTSHQFYYWIDGVKRTDFYADGWSEDTADSQNSVILTAT